MAKRMIAAALITHVLSLALGQKKDNLPRMELSLKNVVDLAISQSSSVKYEQNRYENFYWRWKNFQAQFRPQLVLSGDLPNYEKGTRPITQNDGSVQFREVGYFKNSAQLAVNQSIPQLGTQIYAKSTLFRYEDLVHDYTNFQGNPYLIGVTQPIFAYNWMKWSKKTEPLVYTEAQKDFIESIEEISQKATSLFFRYLTVQTNYRLAENNLNNSKDNLKIAETKIKLGTISENDYSRIKLSVLTAQKSLSQANMDLKNADFALKKYIGLEQNINIELLMPLQMALFKIDPDKALKEALENRKETTQYQRRLIEAQRNLTKAKRGNGLAATLKGTYGTTNIGENIPGVYENTVNQQSVRLSLAIPILDWGKSSSNVKLAESKRDLVLFDVQQDRENFERNVVVQVEQFGLLKEQLEIAKEADNVAGNGYLIALKKFQNGEISITDLNISLSERDKAKRDYIKSLQSYWTSYYLLRELTLYDFEKDQKINYENPLLSGLKK
ncbi:type I secretion outer membrane protein [Saccharicrinis fermentans DSM 9555 = JCM 21142]|uniref:Type I secretion outer membrane protein n=2 Tax=Saccharicrinis fermentans TaxID=982 RepID=W7Y904_9BACT|nr:type I secretion outer membrane protein [Saccharicrinis fermentans DSM 9555 = JCM 21142]